jgi:hypothetical protein
MATESTTSTLNTEQGKPKRNTEKVGNLYLSLFIL